MCICANSIDYSAGKIFGCYGVTVCWKVNIHLVFSGYRSTDRTQPSSHQTFSSHLHPRTGLSGPILIASLKVSPPRILTRPLEMSPQLSIEVVPNAHPVHSISTSHSQNRNQASMSSTTNQWYRFGDSPRLKPFRQAMPCLTSRTWFLGSSRRISPGLVYIATHIPLTGNYPVCEEGGLFFNLKRCYMRKHCAWKCTASASCVR